MSNCVSELLLNLSETPHFQSGRSSKVQQKNTKNAKFSLQTQSHRAADKFCTWSRCWKKFHLNEMKKCKMTERKVKKEKRRSSLRLKSSVQGLQQAQPNILYLLTLLLRKSPVTFLHPQHVSWASQNSVPPETCFRHLRYDSQTFPQCISTSDNDQEDPTCKIQTQRWRLNTTSCSVSCAANISSTFSSWARRHSFIIRFVVWTDCFSMSETFCDFKLE